MLVGWSEGRLLGVKANVNVKVNGLWNWIKILNGNQYLRC